MLPHVRSFRPRTPPVRRAKPALVRTLRLDDCTVSMEWNQKLVLQLIEGFKRKRELWDVSSGRYRVFSAKFEAWQALAETFGCEVADLRRKMNSVFASHRRERHKVRQTGRSTWFAYKHLSFMPSHLAEAPYSDADADGDGDGDADEDADADAGNPSVDGVEQATSEDDDDANDPLQQKYIIKEEPVQLEYPAPASTERPRRRLVKSERAVQKRQPRKRNHAKRTSASDSRVREVARSARRPEGRRRDECDIFGEYIADSLRKHDDRTRSMIKHAINNIIFEQEMKKYVSNQYQVISIDHNPLILPESLDASDGQAAQFHDPDHVPSC